MHPRIMLASTCPVPLRPAPFACPVCGEKLGYNFIVRPGPSGDGYYLIGHDRLSIDPAFAFTMHLEKTALNKMRGFSGQATIDAIAAWCAGLHAAVESDTFLALVAAVSRDVALRPGGAWGSE